MEKILILGATGFVGRNLVGRLTEIKKYDITCLARKTSNIAPLKGTNIVYGDISNEESIINASKGKDIIINLAVPTTQNPAINHEIIVKGTRTIIKAAEKNKIKKIIALSSFAGYRKNLDNYGRSKFEADEVFKKSKLNVILLKPPMIYGRGGYAFEKFLSSAQKIPFLAFVIGNGKNKIQPAYIGDVVDAILSSIKLNHKGLNTFDLGGPYPISHDDFLKKTLKILNKKKLIIHIPLKAVILLAKFVKIFFKNIPWNDITFRRMVEEVVINTKTTQAKLGINFTDYDKGLKAIFSTSSRNNYKSE